MYYFTIIKGRRNTIHYYLNISYHCLIYVNPYYHISQKAFVLNKTSFIPNCSHPGYNLAHSNSIVSCTIDELYQRRRSPEAYRRTYRILDCDGWLRRGRRKQRHQLFRTYNAKEKPPGDQGRYRGRSTG